MSLSDYDGQKAAVASIQRRLDGQLDTIRNTRSYSDAGRKAEMAKAVLAARAQVEGLKSEFAAERETRRKNLERIAFGIIGEPSAFDLMAARDAQDRAAKISTAEDAKAMLHRANQSNDESLAKAVAQAAFNKGWTEVANDYADMWGKRGALDLLADTNAGPRTTLADTTVFRIRNPAELGLGLESDSTLNNLVKDAAG